MKMSWVVRISLTKHTAGENKPYPEDRAFVFCTVSLLITEILRYAGITKVIKDDDRALVFDLYPPPGCIEENWAQHNAKRIASFGINAEAAPRS